MEEAAEGAGDEEDDDGDWDGEEASGDDMAIPKELSDDDEEGPDEET